MPASKPHAHRDAYHVIGQPMRKVDGLARSTGAALYVDDLTLPRMLHCKLLRSPHAHARILSIDASEALAMDGVMAVITGEDMPVQYGVIPWTQDEHPLCVGKVRHIGDGVAAVAATSERLAVAALERIRVVYEPLPAVLSVDDAEQLADDVKVNERARVGNVLKNVNLSFGDLDEGFEKADLVVDQRYYFENTTHAPIEPHCAVANVEHQWRKLDGVVGHPGLALPAPGASPSVLDIARQIAIRVIQPLLGRRLRRQERTLRLGVLRRQALHAHGPPRQVPVYPRRGLL